RRQGRVAAWCSSTERAAGSTRSGWSTTGTGEARYIRRGAARGVLGFGKTCGSRSEVRPDVGAGRHDARALVRLVGVLAQQLELLQLPGLNRDQRSLRGRPVQAAVAAGYPCPWRKLGRVVQLH